VNPYEWCPMEKSSEMRYTQRPEATPGVECSAVAFCYRFILDCYARKQAAGPTEKPDDRDNAKEVEHGAATGSIPGM
jgi:hypothetical protein